MIAKRYLRLYVILCIGLLCIPFITGANVSSGSETTNSNQSLEQPWVMTKGMAGSPNDVDSWVHDDITTSVPSELPAIDLVSGAEPSVAAKHGEAVHTAVEELLDIARYTKSIHVLAMLMVGFGFLMVFVKRYGWGSVTATYIAVSFVLPYYMFLKTQGFCGEPAELKVDRFILAEFCAASMLIAMGAFLGRLKLSQYIVAAVIFVPAYVLNEWIMLENGMGLIPKGALIDTGGSIVIHQFGAYFGLGVIVRMTTSEDFKKSIESDKISNQFSMLGSMVLWIFWPSFCSAPAPLELMTTAAVNTVLSLCGATLSTWIATTIIRKKVVIEDMANAALAGGVAIGSACAYTTPMASVLLGFVAGIISVIGFAFIQPRVQKVLKGIDTCGVHNLHGMPGILGGLAAIFIAKGAVPGLQIKAVFVTFVLAWITGLAAGTVISLFGHRKDSYNDAEEFVLEEH
ncbi:MAG: ammonium transporter [Candidatus Brocadiaceae bacterium]|nr:ammonium transporter [Candidatus Brocadiaceae bacterium]